MDDAQTRIAAAIDATLAPLDRLTGLGPVNGAQLAAVVRGFRQALMVVVAGDPGEAETPRVESVEDEAAASLVAGESEPQFAAEAPADEPLPESAAADVEEPTFFDPDAAPV